MGWKAVSPLADYVALKPDVRINAGSGPEAEGQL